MLLYLDGNANSFETEQDCRDICQAKEIGRHPQILVTPSQYVVPFTDVCVLDKDSGTCDQYKIMWYYDLLSKQCKNFYYGSCGGNANRFGSEQECQLRCLIKAGQLIDQHTGWSRLVSL